MFKDQLNGEIMVKLCEPRAKTYPYLIGCYDDDDDYVKNKIINNKAIRNKEMRNKASPQI